MYIKIKMKQKIQKILNRSKSFDDKTIYATQLFNTMRDDNICDVIKYHESPKSISSNGHNFLMEEGYMFEENIVKCIKTMMVANGEIDLFSTIEYDKTRIDNEYKEQHFMITKDKILEFRYDIIIGGLLYNVKNNTAGYPDLIVSDDWLRKYILQDLRLNNFTTRNRKKIYYIIDIKARSIILINDKENIGNRADYECYKIQVKVYKDILDDIQNYRTQYGFILGKRYKCGDKIVIDNPFGSLGKIDYHYEKTNEMDYSKIINKFIGSFNEVKSLKDERSRRLHYRKNKVLNNMKNKYVSNTFKKLKQVRATIDKELTKIAFIGKKQKQRAYEKGIYNYNDKRLNSSILGLKGKKGLYVDNVLKVLNSKKKSKDIVIPTDNNILNWRERIEKEFFVDFETYNAGEIIYMIGIGFNFRGTWEYKNLIIDYDFKQIKNEEELITNFIDFVLSFKDDNQSIEDYYKTIRLWHYGHAEVSCYNRLLKKLNITSYGKYNMSYFKLPWYDLNRVIKGDLKNPIIIKNTYGYNGLKVVCKELNKLGLITIEWDDLDSGLDSMVIAKNIYTDINFRNKSEEMGKIIKYNEIDCLGVCKILDCLRLYD
jgi:hypothetical protein